MRRLTIIAMLTVLGASLLVACDESANPAVGEVALHNFDPDAGDPWVGLIVEEGPEFEYVFLAEPTQPLGLTEGDPLGWYFNGSVVVTEERGTPGRVQSRAELIEVTDSPPGEPAFVEMVWLGWQGVDPAQFELQAALNHEVVEGFHLHAECYTIAAQEFAVALIDEELKSITAWALAAGDGDFVEVPADQVRCETQIVD